MSTHHTMSKARLDAWIRALESGEYKQGQGFLVQDGGEYCCLGVLGCIEKSEMDPNLDTALPEEVLPLDLQHPLMDRNDGNSFLDIPKHTFPQIAQWLRGNVTPTEDD